MAFQNEAWGLGVFVSVSVCCLLFFFGRAQPALASA
jgi:hypothetical protein